MVHAVPDHGAVSRSTSLRDEYVKAYRVMLLARFLDDKFASLYRMGKIHGGVFLGRQAFTVTGTWTFFSSRADDRLSPTGRPSSHW